jgi:hypothetical protein
LGVGSWELGVGSWEFGIFDFGIYFNLNFELALVLDF